MARNPAPLRAKNQPWSRPLADLVGAVIDPVLAKQGFGETAIIFNWEEIVGSRIARASQPLKLQWPPRGPKTAPDARNEPATLIVQVEGPFALELQHLAHIVIERVNAHLGWRCIGKLAMRQGPVSKRAAHRRPKAAMDPVALEKARYASAAIENEELRAALTRLGTQVLQPAGKRHPDT